jgi:hypothetical protein
MSHTKNASQLAAAQKCAREVLAGMKLADSFAGMQTVCVLDCMAITFLHGVRYALDRMMAEFGLPEAQSDEEQR